MKTIVGLFDDMTQARQAASDLENVGVARNDISLVANNEGAKYAANSGDTVSDTTTTTGGAIGQDAMVGAGIGGAAGLLIGLTGLAIPGLGWVATAGWLTATLIGAGTGAVLGGLVGALTSVGVPEEDAANYSEGVRRGGILIAVKAEDAQANRVAEILGDNGAVNIDERASEYRQGGVAPSATLAAPAVATSAMTTGGTATAGVNAPRTANAQGEIVVPIVEENLAVGKREVQRGGVRVYTHVTQTPVQEQVTLHEEHVNVERRPVDRAVVAGDAMAMKDQTFEVTERAEEAIVSKQARVVEEVVIGKQASDRVETIQDSVRRTDVNVEQIPGQSAATGAYGATGTADTRGVTEKVADAVTGDRVDDKTGNRV